MPNHIHPLPTAGEGVHLDFHWTALEKLEAIYGVKYLSVIIEGLKGFSPKVLRTCADVGLKGATFEEVMERMSPIEFAMNVLDALTPVIGGNWLKRVMESEIVDAAKDDAVAKLGTAAAVAQAKRELVDKLAT